MKAETVLKSLKRMLLEMSDEEYNRLVNLTADLKDEFFGLGMNFVNISLHKCAESKADVQKAA
jgi:hypothetical protein